MSDEEKILLGVAAFLGLLIIYLGIKSYTTAKNWMEDRRKQRQNAFSKQPLKKEQKLVYQYWLMSIPQALSEEVSQELTPKPSDVRK